MTALSSAGTDSELNSETQESLNIREGWPITRPLATRDSTTEKNADRHAYMPCLLVSERSKMIYDLYPKVTELG
jgi:hypothetical protein